MGSLCGSFGRRLAGAAGLVLGLAGPAAADDFTVTITAHQIEALTNTDGWGEQDIYWDVRLEPSPGAGAAAHCNTDDERIDDDNLIRPDWACVVQLSGPADPTVQVTVTAFDQDVTSADDEFDLNPDHAQLGVPMVFRPLTGELTMSGYPAFALPRCALGRIKLSGFGGGGDEPAELLFSISASTANAVDGDSDGDGLLDSWETCGLDGDGDGTAEVDLKAMGADPFRKDVFAEIDWMVDAASAAPHSHEPWLPALIDAWNELNVAQVTNPPDAAGVATPSGIALHLDVGRLYANYGTDMDGTGGPDRIDLNGDGVLDLPVGPSGGLDLDRDGIPDIGDLGPIGGPPGSGGNVLAEDAQLGAPATATLPLTAASIYAAGSDQANLEAANFAAARDPAFHYTIFGHGYPQVQGGPANSSGLAEPCGRSTCNELIVTLGGATRQTVDANLDNVPDPGGAPLLGPSGLQVDGTVNQHVGTFLHELGHNLALQHGGNDNNNFKPNYFSIENYSWQTQGLAFDANADLLADQLTVNFNGDTINDVRRFSFGPPPVLASLNENALNETVAVAPGSQLLTSYSCTPAGAPGPVTRTIRAAAAPDWNCDNLNSAAIPPADINNSGTLETLTGFDDLARLANGGVNLNGPGIGLDEERALRARTQRITEPVQREGQALRCAEERRLDFEELDRGTRLDVQYAPDVTFVADGRRAPLVIGPGERNDVPTASPHLSVLNEARDGPAPLGLVFARPQRSVTLSFGQAGLTSGPQERIRAVLVAFDQDDLPMGRIVKPLPPAAQGITREVTAIAIYPDQLIRRIELSYEFGRPEQPFSPGTLLAEPVEIDDLVVCAQLEAIPPTQTQPEPPRWGDLPVQLGLRSEVLIQQPGPATGEPGKLVEVPIGVTGLTVLVDGMPATTDTTLVRNEGTSVRLEAPGTFASGRFLYWRHSSGTRFGTGSNAVPLTLLRDGTMTAVYQGRRLER